ncbi:hypothetical protein [Myceligenerans pegani]|uniref:Uncharacterized protein n=1 Tax=Myceligenerans pegani TaxID=2776917 RepID=A0ABR9N053_9MICO|nr:hypothetical protein [Myceligenerans sp. TRM 65318]MBE1876621.1 hypothetical protein [Myceligenerans sp. TRM 65318]MBE3018892.1 hypothetical protein [Myceligenerans sp. TRM 65318]
MTKFMNRARQPDAPVQMIRNVARRVGDLNEQIRIGMSGLSADSSAPRILVRHGRSAVLDACELWGTSGRPPSLRRLCELPGGVGLRMQWIEQAVTNAGLTFPTRDLGLRGRWRRIQPPGSPTVWFELDLLPVDRPEAPHLEAAAGPR